MNILLVAMLDSVHTARWVSQFAESGISFTIFPSTPSRRVHSTLRTMRLKFNDQLVTIRPLDRFSAFPLGTLDLFIGRRLQGWRLRRLLKTESFDAIHLLETQHAGYLYLQSIRSVGKSLPVGLSVWGSDLAWFNKSKRHNKRIGKVLENTDLLFIECCRDIELALEFGYRGGFTPPIPASGGVASAEAFLAEQENLLPSERKKIVVKGYTGFVGRARTALRVIEKNANRLENYSIDVYSASFATVVRLWAMRRRTRLRIHGHRKKSLTHSEVLQLFRDARVSMAVSLSDGLPGSFREAVWTGAFPIESNGSCVNEWMTSSNDCIIVDPENIESISSALLRAIQDDTMVDNARTANRRLAEKFTTENIRELSLSQYARLWEIKELESYR